MSQDSKSVDIRTNPLYPDRIESNAVGVLIAVVSMIVAIICLGLIVMNFSYAVHPEKVPGYVSSAVDGTDSYEDNTYEDTGDETYEEDAATETTEEFVYEDTDDVEQNTMEEVSEEAAAEETVVEETGDYVIADSASRYLTRDDLVGMSAEELRIARNEIYARHGRMFDDETLQAYFDSKSWYSGTIAPADFSEDMLNDYERQNTYTITDYETEMGYR